MFQIKWCKFLCDALRSGSLTGCFQRAHYNVQDSSIAIIYIFVYKHVHSIRSKAGDRYCIIVLNVSFYKCDICGIKLTEFKLVIVKITVI